MADASQKGSGQVSTLEKGALPLWTKVLYGAGDTGFSLAYTVLDVYLLFFLYAGGAQPPLPYPAEGTDGTPDSLRCK